MPDILKFQDTLNVHKATELLNRKTPMICSLKWQLTFVRNWNFFMPLTQKCISTIDWFQKQKRKILSNMYERCEVSLAVESCNNGNLNWEMWSYLMKWKLFLEKHFLVINFNVLVRQEKSTYVFHLKICNLLLLFRSFVRNFSIP